MLFPASSLKYVKILVILSFIWNFFTKFKETFGLKMCFVCSLKYRVLLFAKIWRDRYLLFVDVHLKRWSSGLQTEVFSVIVWGEHQEGNSLLWEGVLTKLSKSCWFILCLLQARLTISTLPIMSHVRVLGCFSLVAVVFLFYCWEERRYVPSLCFKFYFETVSVSCPGWPWI